MYNKFSVLLAMLLVFSMIGWAVSNKTEEEETPGVMTRAFSMDRITNAIGKLITMPLTIASEVTDDIIDAANSTKNSSAGSA